MTEETQVVELSDDFYRDGFNKVITIILALTTALIILICMSLYLYLSKPDPVTFHVGQDWRVLDPVPVDQPYLSQADLFQWVSDIFPKAFTYDFNHYKEQLQSHMQYFTPEGWQVFSNQLNNYINYNNVQVNKQFISAAPSGAPLLDKEGLLSGQYAWQVTMPVTITTINTVGVGNTTTQEVPFQLTIVRVPTTNNLTGVAISSVVVKNPKEVIQGTSTGTVTGLGTQ